MVGAKGGKRGGEQSPGGRKHTKDHASREGLGVERRRQS